MRSSRDSAASETDLEGLERGPRPARFARLERTRTLAGAALDRWRRSEIAVVGAGTIGGRFAIEAARSGARVLVCDPDLGVVANLGTQVAREDEPKCVTVARAALDARPDSATALALDVRHVGPGRLARASLLVDATDDPALAWHLTAISNGLGLPLLRLALDGSGEREFGRVLTSHGGAGHACQLCPLTPRDLLAREERTPCPGRAELDPARTAAGGALALAIAGLGLLQAQRLLGGNDLELALDREVLVDLTDLAILPGVLRRADRCPSGHRAWRVVEWEERSSDVTCDALWAHAASALGCDERQVEIECPEHPLCLETWCVCGARTPGVGTVFRGTAPCAACGARPVWRRDAVVPRLTRSLARALSIGSRTLAELGFPLLGAHFVLRAPERDALDLLTSVAPDAGPWRVS